MNLLNEGVLVYGPLFIDHVIQFTKPVIFGENNSYSVSQNSLGGCFNVAKALKSRNHNFEIVTQVIPQDAEETKEFQEFGAIVHEYIDGEPHRVVVIAEEPYSRRTSLVAKAAPADLKPEFRKLPKFKVALLCYLDYLSLDSFTLQLLREMHEEIVVDLARNGQDTNQSQIQECLNHGLIDHLVISEEEARSYGITDIKLAKLITLGLLKSYAIHEPSRVKFGDSMGVGLIEKPTREFTNVTGAGDAFAGFYAVSLLAPQRLPDRVEYAMQEATLYLIRNNKNS
jgi:sugar/nucleoside kinase (ribokinase family)